MPRPKPPPTPTEEQGFAVVPPGLEALAAEELAALGVRVTDTERGGVAFLTDRATLYRVHLHARIPVRIRVRLGTFRARNLETLAQRVRGLPLAPYLAPRQPVSVRVVSSGSPMSARTGAGRKVEHAIRDALRGAGPPQRARSGPPSRQEPIEVLVRIEGEEVWVSIDASGERLHRRGWRRDVTEAPLRENLAAAVLHLAEWQPDEPLVDPMCGSGTFLVEAATIALGIPPGSERAFAFEQWPSHDPALWRSIHAEVGRRGGPSAPLLGSDIDETAVRAARANARRAGVAERMSLSVAPVRDLVLPETAGLVVCNPPYGERLRGASAAWRDLGEALAARGAGWRVALVAPEGPGAALVRATRLPLRSVARFDNGGIAVLLYVGPAVGPAPGRRPGGPIRGGRRSNADELG